MEAKLASKLLAAALIWASVNGACAEEPPLPFPMEGEPLSLADDEPRELAHPAALRGMDALERVRDAFSLDAEQAAPEKHRDASVKQTSTNPTSPRGQELLSLFAEAERAAGREPSISDLTDLIERCEKTAEKLDANPRAALDRLTSWAYNRRGELLTVAGKPHDAFADFQHAIVLDDRNAYALDNRGVTLAEYDRPSQALDDFNRAVALRPTNAAFRRNRAELLAGQGEHQAALRDYAAAFKHGGADAGLYSGSGYCQARLGRQEHALRDYNQALRLAPNDAQTLALRGSLYAQAGYYEQATADLSAALAADPMHADAYQSIAWLLATCPDKRFRDADKAIEAARRAQQFGPVNNPLALDVLAAAHASAGQMREAVRVQQQAAMLAPAGLKRAFEQRLTLYRAGKPYREPARQVSATPNTVGQSLR